MLQPAVAAGRARLGNRQFVKEMDADDGKQGQSPHIDHETRQHAAAFVGKAVQDRMNPGRIVKGGTAAQKRLHQTPECTLTLS